MTAEYFIIAGAQRCGTTSLYEMLDDHPEIEMAKPARPEPKFFLDAGALRAGVSEYRHRFFSQRKRLRGEKSTSYVEFPDAGRRIAELLPSARIIIVLREPITRAISNYRFSVDNGVEHLSLEEALCAEFAGNRPYDASRFSTSPFAYLRRSRYADYIGSFIECFDPALVHIALLDDLVAGPGLDEICTFLGVDATAIERSALRVVNASSTVDVSLSTDVRRDLVAHLREPTQRLAQQLRRDLSEWLDRAAAFQLSGRLSAVLHDD